MKPFSLNLHGRLVQYDHPVVMGILNVTPDSFYSASRATADADIAARAVRLATAGADIIDIGAYSTRPGATEVSEADETERLCNAISIVRSAVGTDKPISADTFRASVARKAVECGADIINDVAGGNLDHEMFATVADLNVPYVLGHMRGSVSDMMEYSKYEDVCRDVLCELGDRLQQLALMGVNDVIIDPGFGFSKTLEQNYSLLGNLKLFELLHRPILVGFSRKSMISRQLGITTEEALNGTTVLNTLALDRGADILRVHDPLEASQAVSLWLKTSSASVIQH